MRRTLARATAAALALALLTPAVVAAAPSGDHGCIGYKLSNATIELPPGYWTAGQHTFALAFIDPAVSDNVWGPFEFTVSPSAPMYAGQVQLAYMLRWDYDALPDQTINPAQDTVFWAGWAWDPSVPMADMKAELAQAPIYFQWDGGDWVAAHQGPISSLCVGGFLTGTGNGFFYRNWGGK